MYTDSTVCEINVYANSKKIAFGLQFKALQNVLPYL